MWHGRAVARARFVLSTRAAGAGADIVAAPSAPFYILRPETFESLFVLQQITGNPVSAATVSSVRPRRPTSAQIYRDWGWNMIKSIDKYCRTTYGHGAYPVSHCQRALASCGARDTHVTAAPDAGRAVD